MDDNSVKNRLIAFIKYKHLTKTAFGESIGVSNAFVTSIRRSIAPDKVQSIASTYPELNMDWLLYGKGDMLLTSDQNREEVPLPDASGRGDPSTPSMTVGGHVSGNGNNISHNDSENIAGMIALQKGYQELLKKSQQQIDRLIGIIEKGGKQC